MTTEANSPNATTRPMLRRRWLVGIVAAVAVTTIAPAVAGAQSNGGGDNGNYVTTKIPSGRSIDVLASSPACIGEAPYINYSIVPVGFVPVDGTATLRMSDRTGRLVQTVNVSSLSGSIIYPGASVDSAGNATDWPGWVRAEDGSWTRDESDAALREGLTIEVTASNLSASASVSYPDAGFPCAGPELLASSPSGEGGGALPQTGSNGMTGLMSIGAMSLLAGAAALATTRRRRNSDLHTAI